MNLKSTQSDYLICTQIVLRDRKANDLTRNCLNPVSELYDYKVPQNELELDEPELDIRSGVVTIQNEIFL